MKMMKHGPCMMHHPGMHHSIPTGLYALPITIIAGTLLSIMLSKRMLMALETIALTNALDKMEGRLSDVEKADIESRIRTRLFQVGRFGCCGH